MADISFRADGPTIEITAEFDATPEQLWEVFTDPRKLEKWWGPPTWPATFSRFELTPNGEVRYHMTGPGGEESHGWWQFHSTTFPVLEFTDGFSDSEGVPDLDLPASRVRVEVLESGGLGQIRFTSVYESEEAVTTVLTMGLQEGITLAMQQIEGIV